MFLSTHHYCLMLWLMTLIAQASLWGQVTGRVVDVNGDPTAGVEAYIWLHSGAMDQTDTDGRFSLGWDTGRRVWTLLFRHADYRPRVIVVDLDRNDPVFVTLDRKPEGYDWIIPPCPQSGGEDRSLGFRLRVQIAEESRTEGPFIGQHSKVSYLRLEAESLRFGTSPSWGSGVPSPDLISDAIETKVREVFVEGEEDPGWRRLLDVQGLHKDGKHWRWVGDFDETIDYTGASARAAKHFDRILSTLCYADPTR